MEKNVDLVIFSHMVTDTFLGNAKFAVLYKEYKLSPSEQNCYLVKMYMATILCPGEEKANIDFSLSNE